MNWLAIISGLISLAAAVTKFLSDRKLIKLEDANRIIGELNGTIDTVTLTQMARNSVDHSDDSVLNDPDNRKSDS